MLQHFKVVSAYFNVNGFAHRRTVAFFFYRNFGTRHTGSFKFLLNGILLKKI